MHSFSRGFADENQAAPGLAARKTRQIRQKPHDTRYILVY
jgi:hypothetical protein